MQRSHPFVLLLVAGLFTGCVSSSKYHELETKASTERTSLEKDIASLRSQVASQRDEVARREAQIASLNQQISSLNQQSTDLEAKKAGLERDIAALGDRLGDAEKRAAEAAAQKDAEINRLKGTYDSLVKDLQSEIVEKILFDSGKAEIKPQGKDVLGKVGQVLLGVKDKQIRIEGYTDSVPIGVALRQQFPTNWELSAVRATTVLRFLEEKAGVDGKNLAAVGYGPFRPVASNDTTEGKAENRRIEITLTPLDVQEVLKGLK